MAQQFWMSDRQLSRRYRKLARHWGFSVPALRPAVLVELEKIYVPLWAREKAIPGLASDETKVWLGRINAKVLAGLDREAGGTPKLTTTVYRKCRFCKRVLLGILAEELFEKDRQPGGEFSPCGPDCVEVEKLRRPRAGRSKG
jgi:hypothetical protein